MPQVTGSFGRVVIDTEQTYKTEKTTKAGWIIPFTTCSLGKDQNLLESNTISASRNPQQPGLGQINVSGDLSVELGGAAHTRLLYLALGGYSVTGTGPYTHTIKVGSSIPSFITEVRFSDGDAFTRYAKYDGCKINQWSFAVRTDAFVESTFSIIGSEEVFGSTAYQADTDLEDPGLKPFTNYNATLYLGGSAVAFITEISFTVTNNLDENTFAIGSGSARTSLPEGRVAVNGSFTAQFVEDVETYINIAQNSDETQIQIDLQRGTGDGTDGNEKISILFPEVKLQPPRKEIPGPQGVFLTFNFIAYADDTDSAIQVTCNNSIADLSI